MIAPYSTRLPPHAPLPRLLSRPQIQRVQSQTTSPQLEPRCQIAPRDRILNQVERIPQHPSNPIPARPRPRIGARSNQQLERRHMHAQHREIERAHPVARLGLHIGARGQQDLQCRGVPGDSRVVDRLHLEIASHDQVRVHVGRAADISARRDERRDDNGVRVPHPTRDVQCRVAVIRQRRHGGPRVEEELDNLLELRRAWDFCVGGVPCVVPARLHQRAVQRGEADGVAAEWSHGVVEHPASRVVTVVDARAVVEQQRYYAGAAEADGVDEGGFLELGMAGGYFVRVDADREHVRHGAFDTGRDEVL